MDKESAEKYLERKGVENTEKNVQEVMRRGKIYGDPVAECM
jgi:hypothetical protein